MKIAQIQPENKDMFVLNFALHLMLLFFQTFSTFQKYLYLKIKVFNYSVTVWIKNVVIKFI